MYTKCMLAVGAGVLVGAGMFWMRKRYLNEKTRQELKAHSNIDNDIPAITDSREDDTIQRQSTLADQTNLSNGIPTTNRRDQDLEHYGLRITSAVQINIDYGVHETTDESEEDILYRESTSAGQTQIFEDIPATTDEFIQCPSVEKTKGFLPLDEIILSEREDDTIQRPSTLADRTNLNNGIPTTNRRRGRYFIGKNILYREVDIYRPSTSAIQTHIVQVKPSTTNTRRKYFIEKKLCYREKNISHRPSGKYFG